MKYTITIAVFVLAAGLAQAKALPGLGGKSFISKRFGRLPHYWGQEAVFTPEARRWLARLDLATKEGFYRPTVGIWDVFQGDDGEGGRISYEALQDASVVRVGQELQEELAANASSTRLGTHGLYVTSLAVGKPPFGISVLGELNFLINANENNGSKIDPQDLHGSISRLDVLNFSCCIEDAFGFGWDFSDKPVPGLSDVLPGYTTVVRAAGNNPFRLFSRYFIGPHEPILVGAIDSNGEMRGYSNNGHIYAPGYHRFPDGSIEWGTSFSTPMVSGALADMFAILPPTAITSLTAKPIVSSDVRPMPELSEFHDLIVHLLQKTSTPMVNNIRSGGILNHYKLLRAAHRIAQQAGSGDQSVAQLIEDSRTYDFTAEARQLYEETVRLHNSAEVEPQEVLSKLREAVALDAHNQDARRALGEIYAQAGYTSLAEFYSSSIVPIAKQQPRIHRTMDMEEEESLYFKMDLLEAYAREIYTPQLVDKYLDKDLLLAMMWAYGDIGRTNPGDILRDILPEDNPWVSFNVKNPLPFIINYSKDVQQAKQLVDAVLERFDISTEKLTFTLPSVWDESDESREVLSARRIEIDTYFLLGEERVAQQKITEASNQAPERGLTTEGGNLQDKATEVGGESEITAFDKQLDEHLDDLKRLSKKAAENPDDEQAVKEARNAEKGTYAIMEAMIEEAGSAELAGRSVIRALSVIADFSIDLLLENLHEANTPAALQGAKKEIKHINEYLTELRAEDYSVLEKEDIFKEIVDFYLPDPRETYDNFEAYVAAHKQATGTKLEAELRELWDNYDNIYATRVEKLIKNLANDTIKMYERILDKLSSAITAFDKQLDEHLDDFKRLSKKAAENPDDEQAVKEAKDASERIDAMIKEAGEERVARQLPLFAGQSLNLVEWSILHDSRKLFAYHYEMLHAIIKSYVLSSYTTMDEMSAADDADSMELANKIAKELEGHINFTVKHTDNREALKKLLDLHKQVSSASEHQALLDSITPN